MGEIEMFNAVIFDLDETLISHSQQMKRFILSQYNRYYTHLKHIPFEIWEERFITLEQNGYVTKDIVYRQLIEEFSLKRPTYEELYNDFLNSFHKYVVTSPYMTEILNYLRDSNIKTGIITNGGYLIQNRKIKSIGLHLITDVILISEQEGIEKPEAEIFLRGARMLSVQPEKCLFVGDHPINDIIGSQRAGMKSAWISNSRQWKESDFHPDFIIQNLLELKAIVTKKHSVLI
jgi:putative hydrolase of the HAD superfamily